MKMFRCKQLLLEIFGVIASSAQMFFFSQFPPRGISTSNGKQAERGQPGDYNLCI